MARGREKATVQTAPAEGPWELPEGWRWERLISVTSPPKKGDPAKLFSDTFRYIDVGGLADGEPVKLLPVAQAPSRARQLVKSGDTLLSGVRVNLKRNLFIDGDYADVASTAFSVLRPNPDLVPEFLFYWVNSDIFMRWLLPLQRGGTPPAVLDQDVRDQLIPVPPLETQRRIVARIDELLSELDDGETALARARKDLEVYRKALLKAAVTGELTADWRAANPPKETGEQLLKRILSERRARWEADPKNKGKRYKEPAAPDTSGLPELPEGWAWASIDQLSTVVRGASPRPAGDPRFFGGTIPWITVGALTKDDNMFLDEVALFVTPAGRDASRYIEPGTLLFTNSGATLGVPKITRIGGCINDGSVALLDLADPLKSYLYYYLKTKTEELRFMNQGAAQPNLNTGIVKGIFAPLPPEREMEVIISELSRLYESQPLSRDDILTATQLSRDLKNSILAAAFKGELVQ